MEAPSKQFYIIMNGLPLVPSHNREVNFEEFNLPLSRAPPAAGDQLGEDVK